MNDLSKRHLTEDEVAVYLDDKSNSPKEIENHINCCADCAELVATVLECTAYEEAVESEPLTAVQKQEKFELIEKLFQNNADSVQETNASRDQDVKKHKGQRGDWGTFFTGLLGGQGIGDLFESGATSPIPALGDKGELLDDPKDAENIESSKESNDIGSESEEFPESPITNDDNDTSIDSDIDDLGSEAAFGHHDHDFDDDASSLESEDTDNDNIDGNDEFLD